MPEAHSRENGIAWKDHHSQMREEMEPTPPPPIVLTPLFVWHLAVWSPVVVAESQTQATRKQNRRLRRIDLAIVQLLARLAFFQPGVSEIETDFRDGEELCLFGLPVSQLAKAKRDRSLLKRAAGVGDGHEQVRAMRITWFGLKITFRFEVLAEIVMLTTYVDASSLPAATPEATVEVSRSLDMLRSGLSELNALLCDGEMNSGKYGEVFKRIYKAPRKTILLHILRMETKDVLPFGSDFADFRGLVISSPAEPPASGAERFFALPGETPLIDDAVSPWPSPAPLSSKRWQAKLRVLWPFLMTPPAEAASPEQHELTISRMLGGRALLTTSLSLDQQKSVRSPLHYLIYTNGTSPWETGRMLNTLAHTGTFRLAALLNMGKMRRVAPQLTVCETLIRKALDTLAQKFDGDAEMLDEAERQIRIVKARADVLADCLPRIGESLNAMTAEFSRKNNAPLQADNFERRIALSRLYVARFRQLVARLRIERLEGFVPYDEFVERKLGAAYALIDLISARFERIKADVTSLRQIETAQRSRLSGDQISRFQETADIVLFFFLLPYYAGEVLIEKIGGMHDNDRWAWLGVWLLSAAIGIERSRHLLQRLGHEALSQRGIPTTDGVEPVSEF